MLRPSMRRRAARSRVLLRLWASPWSLLGMALAPFFARRSLRDGVLLCEGAAWPRRLGFRHRAMTLGHVVLCIDVIDDETWSHELVHVAQYERLGPLFLLAYALASLVARARGGHVYSDNRFEREARRRAGH
jgi:hypothetical protein